MKLVHVQPEAEETEREQEKILSARTPVSQKMCQLTKLKSKSNERRMKNQFKNDSPVEKIPHGLHDQTQISGGADPSVLNMESQNSMSLRA